MYKRQGQTIRFIQNVKGGFRRGQHYEVISPSPAEKAKQEVKVKEMSTGRIMSLPYRTPEQYSVYRQSTIELGKGDLIKPSLNLRSQEGAQLNNGTSQKVKGFNRQGDIVLENGKTLAKDSYHIAHNYASTSHASQGATVKDVFISITEESAPAVNQQTLYVAVSRGKSKVKLFTDNRKSLKAAIQRTSERKTANEVAKEHQLRLMRQKQINHYQSVTQTKGKYEQKKTIQRQSTHLSRHI